VRALGLAVRVMGMRAALVKSKVSPTLFGKTFRASRADELARWEARIASMPGADVARATKAWATRGDLLDRVGAIRAPTLLLTGDEDVPHPREHADEIHARVAGARVETIARGGHTLPLERSEEVARAIRAFTAA
jgi:pimeloyl-ACP methyl ester carboxylesterase